LKEKKFLIVEDDPDHAELICRSFDSASERAGVTVAHNIHEARINIAESVPDLIIADYVLADGNGTELIPSDREESPYPVIILTSHGDEKIAVEAMKAGAFDYIVKSEVTLENMPHICERIMREWNHTIERKKAEKWLKESEARFQSVLSSLYESAVVIYDRDGKITALWGTPEMDKRYGIRAIDTIGRSIRDFVPPDQEEQRLAEIHRVFDKGDKMLVEYMDVMPRGIFWKEVSLSPMRDANGNITAVVGFIRDITERKKMEEKLLQSEKLQSLGTITAGVSHEFNNILAIISGNAQLLEGSLKDDKELMDILRTIRRATNDGAQISRRMLKFTKTAKDTTGFVPFDINELINQAINFTMPKWRNMAQAKGINYHVDTDGMKRVPSILCNPTELRGVFVNIINNALDAMPDDGRISFSTWSEDGTVFISISDTGEGMPDEVKKNIFDPFYTTKTAVGTGLGMSTAYGIVTGHGGKIEVESAVGKGSTFTLQLPAAAKADITNESPETKQEINTNGLRILVVDDNEEICNILDKFFSKKGHLVRTVDNGRDAIILTKVDDYDLVLCDMAMPEVFGYDVIKALNKLEKRPKVGIMTGWNEKLKPIDDEVFKIDFIIKKPFDFSTITRHINDAFTR